MARRLILMRHAKSDWDAHARSDFERPLSKRGRRDAPRMGYWLRDEPLQPDCIVSSPARRARQTVTEVCTALGIDPDSIQWQPRVYEADLGALFQVLAAIPATARCVLLVGHNPGLEGLLTHLVGASGIKAWQVANKRTDKGSGAADGEYPPEFGLIKTATVVQLAMPDLWADLSPGCAHLIGIKSPKELDD
ncbi:MAG: histidine phosphatase family protein [Magnetococcales bacterium]|nr:histidine phosphatase family protein [Magnetococcales bacterium]